MMCHRRAYKIILCAIAILSGMWLCGFFGFDHAINHFQTDISTKTDAIVVVTGGRNRISEGIRLLNEHLSEKLFISGVAKATNVQDILDKSFVKTEYKDKIELGYQATNTIENASEIARWIRKNHIRSMRFVTSNYHVPRSLAELSAYHKTVKIIIHPVYSENVAHNWWQSWGTCRLFAAEYNKFLFVIIRNMFQSLTGE
ncbi:MAG: YdcF family protein [Alphaproteobacteria bacterium]|nr:YdcF family protein [Alphaproteobacteria bacterium]